MSHAFFHFLFYFHSSKEWRLSLHSTCLAWDLWNRVSFLCTSFSSFVCTRNTCPDKLYKWISSDIFSRPLFQAIYSLFQTPKSIIIIIILFFLMNPATFHLIVSPTVPFSEHNSDYYFLPLIRKRFCFLQNYWKQLGEETFQIVMNKHHWKKTDMQTYKIALGVKTLSSKF